MVENSEDGEENDGIFVKVREATKMSLLLSTGNMDGVGVGSPLCNVTRKKIFSNILDS